MPTRALVILGITLLLPAFSLYLGADEKAPAEEKGPPVLPGSFQTLRLTDPQPEKVSRVGRYYSPVDDIGLNPGVLVFLADLDQPAKADTDQPDKAVMAQPISGLLKNIDEIMGKYPDVRMGGCVLLMDDGGYRDAMEDKIDDLEKNLDLERDQEAKLTGLAKDAGVKNMVLGLGMTKDDRKTFGIDPDAGVTVLLCSKQRIMKRFSFAKGKLSDTDVTTVTGVFESIAKESKKATYLGTQ